MASSIPLSTTSKTRIAWRPLLAVSVTILLWASAYSVIRVGLLSFSPTGMALFRYLIASIILAVYVVVTKMPLPQWRDLPVLAVSGFLGIALYVVAVSMGEQEIFAGTASLIVAAAPIFVCLLAVLFLHERLRLWGWLGILLSFVGVAIISLRPDQGFQLSHGALIVLIAAVAQAGYTVIQKPYLTRYSPLQCTTVAIWGATICLLVFTPEMVAQVTTASLQAILAVVFLAIFPGITAYLCWAYALTHMPASRAGSFLYFIPAVAIGIAWLWLGEIPTLAAALGGVLILAGVIMVNFIGRQKTVKG